MKVLKNAGRYEILTTPEELQAQLLRIEEAGRTCYQSDNPERSIKSATRFVQMLIKRGHESVLEHSCMTVRFLDLSRGFTHEQVRHRLTAISQESTRYVDYAKFGDENPDLDKFEIKCVVPPHRDENEGIPVPLPFTEAIYRALREAGWEQKEPYSGNKLPVTLTPTEMFDTYEAFYRALRKTGWKPEDARQFLPIGLKSEIVISGNFRGWRHIFVMRCSKFAHWEIRGVMVQLLERCLKLLPGVFDDFEYKGTCERGIPYWGKKEVI